MLCLKRFPIAVALLATVAFSLPVSAGPGDAIVNWTTELVDHNAVDAGNVRGRPDNDFAAISDFHYVWVRRFERKISYKGLAKFLGVTNAQLARADVIAFEFNAGGPAGGNGWESSTWFFSDLRRAYAETFDELTGLGTITTGRRARFKTGDMLGSAYGAFFGIPTPPTVHVSWILIDVPNDIDVRSPQFSVWVSGAKVYPEPPPVGEQGSPEPDAVGVLSPL